MGKKSPLHWEARGRTLHPSPSSVHPVDWVPRDGLGVWFKDHHHVSPKGTLGGFYPTLVFPPVSPARNLCPKSCASRRALRLGPS